MSPMTLEEMEGRVYDPAFPKASRGADGRPIAVSLSSTPLTDEERQDADEFAERQRQDYDAMRRRMASDEKAKQAGQIENDPTIRRPANQPHGTQIEPWGNCFIGYVITNAELERASGIIIPNSPETMNKPHACIVVKISPDLDRAKCPRLCEGIAILYDYYTGKEWTDEHTGTAFVIMDATTPMGILGTFNPKEVAASGHKVAENGRISPPETVLQK